MTDWQRYDEPLRTTLTRTVGIAVVAGGVVASRWGGLGRWPVATMLMLWPSFGGHWLEIWFLNRLRARLPATRAVQVAARLAVWFAGGIGLAAGMALTAAVLTRRLRFPLAAWWMGGLAFIGIELIAHLGLQLRGRPSFFNGRG
jgi:hypothetical protein